jgi:predicted acylesterase/phospholipase RssA
MLKHQDTVVGLFGDPERARDAIAALKDAGSAAEDITLLMPDRVAALGAGAGAIAGALVGMGVSEDEARYYEQEVRGGQTLVAVRAERRWLDEADRILRQFGAHAVTRSRRSISNGGGGGPLDYEPLQRSAQDRSELGRPMVASTTTSQTDWVDQVPQYRAGWQARSR